MKDASMIVDALIAVSAGTQILNAAIGEYEAEMIPRGAQEVALSHQLATTRKNARYEDDVVRLGLNRSDVKI
jgi:hypothetical protein